jgi:hemin uptake protein HemP
MTAPATSSSFSGEAFPIHDANALTAGGPSALIRLNDQVYTLRITRQGKLILTK